jgi:hypothetical protein
MRGRFVAAAALAALLVGGAAGSARAAPVTLTSHEKKEVFTFHDLAPCIGNGSELATITVTETGVFHVTAAGIDDQGTPDPQDDVFIPPYHVTGTFTGTFVAVPDDPALPTFAGHFTQWFGENANPSTHEGTFTFTIIGKGTDGSTLKFHETAHFLVTPTGATVEFDRPTCR